MTKSKTTKVPVKVKKSETKQKDCDNCVINGKVTGLNRYDYSQYCSKCNGSGKITA